MLETPLEFIEEKAKKSKEQLVHYYSKREEQINIISHGIGFIASIVGAILLLIKSFHIDDPKHLISYLIYSFGLITLFGASTLYHSTQNLRWRRRFNIFDHAAIFLMIAGSYTPFTLISLNGALGWSIFGIIWSVAFIGVILKLFFTGRYKKISTLMYILMGWMILFVISPLTAALPTPALVLLFTGGILYSIGAVFFSIEKIKFNHAIFHFFVLGGSLTHFLSIYLYL